MPLVEVQLLLQFGFALVRGGPGVLLMLIFFSFFQDAEDLEKSWLLLADIYIQVSVH